MYFDASFGLIGLGCEWFTPNSSLHIAQAIKDVSALLIESFASELNHLPNKLCKEIYEKFLLSTCFSLSVNSYLIGI